jgi:predicted alpha-1,2-mannosidase
MFINITCPFVHSNTRFTAQKYGFIPKNAPQTNGGSCPEVVSQSLNYMQADFAIAKVAASLGFNEDADFLMKRALNYASLFDNSTHFFRSRSLANQEFVEPFDQFAWGDDYTEGGPWQFKFYVPHDPKGLASLYSSVNQNLCDHLQSAQTQKSTFHIGGYGTEIHEETEMPDGCWGQYAHNNQPVHHMLYMFAAADSDGYRGACSSRGQYWLRKATSTLYKPTADMFAGDEDNGEMGAWYVLSTMGLYGLNPGTDEYVLGSPLFGRIDVALCDVAPCSTGTLSVYLC